MNPGTIVNFCIGPIDVTMLSFAGIIIINTISKIIDTKTVKPILEESLKAAFAYLVFIMIANRMDAAGITAAMGWKSTQYLVVIGLAAREAIDLLKRISTKWGIAIPGILDNRLSKIESGEVEQSPDYIDPVVLDQRIQNLKNNMDKIKELRRLERELNDLGGPIVQDRNYNSPSGDTQYGSNEPTI